MTVRGGIPRLRETWQQMSAERWMPTWFGRAQNTASLQTQARQESGSGRPPALLVSAFTRSTKTRSSRKLKKPAEAGFFVAIDLTRAAEGVLGAECDRVDVLAVAAARRHLETPAVPIEPQRDAASETDHAADAEARSPPVLGLAAGFRVPP